ncbi:MAG: hypothetical protein ACE5GI_01375 [Candidatus Aminicenantales bacterium]
MEIRLTRSAIPIILIAIVMIALGLIRTSMGLVGISQLLVFLGIMFLIVAIAGGEDLEKLKTDIIKSKVDEVILYISVAIILGVAILFLIFMS